MQNQVFRFRFIHLYMQDVKNLRDRPLRRITSVNLVYDRSIDDYAKNIRTKFNRLTHW